MLQCFCGADETDSLCPALAQTGVEVVVRPGGHHFDGDYDALTRTILAGVSRRLERTAAPVPR